VRDDEVFYDAITSRGADECHFVGGVRCVGQSPAQQWWYAQFRASAATNSFGWRQLDVFD
jgi:hypothetical protein